jgi:two-component system OmpR family sensor kinase
MRLRRTRPKAARFPLRVRLVMLVCTLIVAVVGVIGVVSVSILHQNLMTQVANGVFLATDSAIGRVSAEVDSAKDLDTLGGPFGLFAAPDGYYVIADGDTVLFSVYVAPDYSARDLTDAEAAAVLRRTTGDDTTAISVPELGDFLSLRTSLTLADEPDRELTFVTGGGLDDVNATLRAFMLAEVVIGLLAAAIAASIGYRLVRRELAPLEHVVDVADRVAATPMSSGEASGGERVPLRDEDRDSEAGRVAGALNRLLTHVEASLNARHATEESMRRFVAEASHELRNPLAAIRGYADFTITTPGLDRDVVGALARIGAESLRMTTLVEQLLLLAKLDADPELRIEEIDLSKVVLETVSDARAARPGHRWRLALPPDPAVVLGDEDAIRRILLNLVGNAGHHTPPGTSVTVSLTTAAAATILSVEDDGPGIPEEALPTLFERFTQARPPGDGNTRDASTVGLGLAIVSALADASGFTVSVESRPGRTRFSVLVPHPPRVVDGRAVDGSLERPPHD